MSIYLIVVLIPSEMKKTSFEFFLVKTGFLEIPQVGIRLTLRYAHLNHTIPGPLHQGITGPNFFLLLSRLQEQPPG
jgi:hypothetical protein